MSNFRPWYDDDDLLRRRDGVTIPLFWVAFILSLLVHVAALWVLVTRPPMLMPGMVQNDETVPMSVKIATAPERHPPSAPAQKAVPPPPLPPAPVPPAPRRNAPRPRIPPVIAAMPGVPSTQKLPMLPAPVAPTPPTLRPPPTEMAGDLSSYIALQRQARGEAPARPSANPADDAGARRDRAIAANLASSSSPTYYGEPKNSGGVFQITFIGYDDAEFTFFGWNPDIRRRATERIDVRRGDSPNIRIAIVRRMIAIIRQYEQEDFSWKSVRLGKVVTLSARQADSQALEDFLMLDFFHLPPPGR